MSEWRKGHNSVSLVLQYGMSGNQMTDEYKDVGTKRLAVHNDSEVLQWIGKE